MQRCTPPRVQGRHMTAGGDDVGAPGSLHTEESLESILKLRAEARS